MPSLQGNWYEARSSVTTPMTSASVIGRITTSGADWTSSGEVAIDTYAIRQLSEDAARKLQVLPRLALIRRRAQEIGRMIRHYERSIQLTEIVHFSAQSAERQIRTQQVLRRDTAHRQHQPGLQQCNLAHQVWQAGSDLLRLGIPVVGRPALQDIGDIDVGLSIEVDRPQHRVQQVSRPAHERLTSAVLFGTGSLADPHPMGSLRPYAYYALRAGLVEAARGAARELSAQSLPRLGNITGDGLWRLQDRWRQRRRLRRCRYRLHGLRGLQRSYRPAGASRPDIGA